jgi:hypothetical protein
MKNNKQKNQIIWRQYFVTYLISCYLRTNCSMVKSSNIQTFNIEKINRSHIYLLLLSLGGKVTWREQEQDAACIIYKVISYFYEAIFNICVPYLRDLQSTDFREKHKQICLQICAQTSQGETSFLFSAVNKQRKLKAA